MHLISFIIKTSPIVNSTFNPSLHDILRFIFKNLYILILLIRQRTVYTKCIFIRQLWLPFASVSWPIRDVCWSHISNNCWGKSTRHGHGINTRFEVLDSLPFSYPTIFHLACSNHAIKVWRCTIVPVGKRLKILSDSKMFHQI